LDAMDALLLQSLCDVVCRLSSAFPLPKRKDGLLLSPNLYFTFDASNASLTSAVSAFQQAHAHWLDVSMDTSLGRCKTVWKPFSYGSCINFSANCTDMSLLAG